MISLKQLYYRYGEYNIFYNQLNLPSPSVEYAWRQTKLLLQNEVLALIQSKLMRDKSVQVADIGSGNGALLLRLAQLTREQNVQYSGFELAPPFVAYANSATKTKSLKRILFHELDIEKDALSQTYDIIICSEVLEHLTSPKHVLTKIYQALRPGGCVLLSTPNKKNLIKYPFMFLKGLVTKSNTEELQKYLTKDEETHKLAEKEQHLHVFTFAQLKNMLTEIGFEIYKTPRSTTFFGGPFLDAHRVLFATSLLFDSLADLPGLPQLGWDLLLFAQKTS